MKSILVSLFLILSPLAFAGEGEHKHPMPQMPKEFDSLKALVGTWEGTAKMMSDKDEPVTVVYALTSGGTAITETMMPGTPHEMISVYHKDGKGVAMTHYCAMGNQPVLKLKSHDAKGMFFEMKGTQGISSMKEMHMHALKMTMADADSLLQEWTHMEGGKGKTGAVMNLHRKKASN